MQQAPIPDDEAKRLALLQACKIMYTPAEQAFDDMVRLAADICGTEIALITLVDSDYQWFKARVGVEQTGTPRDLSFCGHCITERHPLVVPDTLLDPRFADNPLVTGDPKIRFYCGVPLEVDTGSAVGALSVADRSPRQLEPRQLESLRRLAAQISRELRLRRDLDRASVTPSAAGPTPGEIPIRAGAVVAGHWRIVREIGRGGVGAVFEAEDAGGERVAIKVLLPQWRMDEMFLERFAREARVLMRLSTPHVAKLLDVGNLGPEQGDLPYLVLEYLQGKDLDQVVEARGRLPYQLAFEWCADAYDGVAEAHELGVVHRDIKPSNVFLADAGSSPSIVKVLDFGIAAGDTKAADWKLTRETHMIGSPGYMSPEQMLASSDVDPRSDVWSMGTLLYVVLTGQLPFEGDNPLAMFTNTLTQPPPPLRERVGEALPPAVEEVVLRCLEKERTNRFPTMSGLAKALRAAAAARA